MNEIDKLKIGSILPFDITKKHPVYLGMEDTWRKCRDAYEGAEAIKKGGERYLARLNEQSNDDYDKYKDRSQWYGATRRTGEAYLGMLFRKNPIFKYIGDDGNPIQDTDLIKEGEKFFSLVTFDGKSIEDFLRSVVTDVMVVNKLGILIDFPDNSTDDGSIKQMSKADYEHAGLKPLLSMYKAESIINWYWEVINNRIVPRFFVLAEEELEFTNTTSLVPEEVINYRILYLQETPKGMVYRQYVIKATQSDKRDKKTEYVVKDIITPLDNGKPLNFIPFDTMTDKGLDYRDNSVSMINGLVNTNIGHYRNSADWENELHWVGIKTLYLPGYDEEVYGKVKLGGAMTGPPDSIPQMIEAKSDSGLQLEMHNKEERMAVLGAERIAQKGRYIPSAETAKINAESENATLINMSKSLSVSISKILTYQMQWADETKKNIKVDMQLNTDFFDETITGKEVLDWIAAAQQGGISFETYYHNMDKKEAFPVGWTMQQEAEKLQEGFPGGVPGNPDDDDVDLTVEPANGNTEPVTIQEG